MIGPTIEKRDTNETFEYDIIHVHVVWDVTFGGSPWRADKLLGTTSTMVAVLPSRINPKHWRSMSRRIAYTRPNGMRRMIISIYYIVSESRNMK